MSLVLDLSLDHEKAAKFNCSTCDVGLARLRNCDGSGKPAKNLLNRKIYPSCPRAAAIADQEARYVVELYMECRESKILPFSGNWGDQTSFCCEVFKYLDSEIAEWKLHKASKTNDSSKGN